MAMSSRRHATFLAVLVLAMAMARLGSSQPDCSGVKGSPELFITVNSGTPMDLMQHAVDDGSSGANDDISLFKPKSGYWFGHTAINAYRDLAFGEPGYTVTYTGQVNATAGSPLATPAGWRRVWGVAKCLPDFVPFSNVHQAFGMHCPIPPPGYVALGCIFRKTNCVYDDKNVKVQADSFSPPPTSEVENLVTLREDLAAPAFSTKPPAFRLWASYGSGADEEGAAYVLYPDTSAGCGLGLGLMLAQAGFDPYDVAGFAVPDFTKVPPCCYFTPGPPAPV